MSGVEHLSAWMCIVVVNIFNIMEQYACMCTYANSMKFNTMK